MEKSSEKESVVWEKGSVTVTLETSPSKELVEHIGRTFLGTPGGLQYQQTTGLEKLQSIKNCYFLILRRAGKIIGSVGYVRRKASAGMGEESLDSWLVRYFSIAAPMRANPAGKRKNREERKPARTPSFLKELTHRFHDNPHRLVDPDTKQIPRAVLYSLVEEENERSRNMVDIFGFEKSGEVASILFSRLRKRKNRPVEKLSSEEIPEMQQRIREFYRDHSLFFGDNLFTDDCYYVRRVNGQIVAGLQANNETWHISTIGNVFIDRIVKMLTRIPAVGRRFRYEEMRFLGIDGIWFKPGHEKELYRLLEGVLALNERYLALMILDTRSPEYRLFRDGRKLGPAHAVFGAFRAGLYTRYYSIPEEERRELMERPAYISIYDNS